MGAEWAMATEDIEDGDAVIARLREGFEPFAVYSQISVTPTFDSSTNEFVPQMGQVTMLALKKLQLVERGEKATDGE